MPIATRLSGQQHLLSDDQIFRQLFNITTSRFAEAKDMRFPHQIVCIDRTVAGHFGNLSRLRAAAPWRRMLEARLGR
jgi:hypothetical protein